MIPISPTNSKIFELKFDFLTIYCVGKTVGGSFAKSPKFREYSQTISVNIYILWVLLTAEKSSEQKPDQKLKFTGFQIAWIKYSPFFMDIKMSSQIQPNN